MQSRQHVFVCLPKIDQLGMQNAELAKACAGVERECLNI